MATAQEWKDKGNAFVKEKKYKEALDCYTEAIKIDPSNHILYSNRSQMHTNLGNFEEGLKDAEKALEIKSDYSKGYQRKGAALKNLGKIDEALEAYKKGLELDPNNAQIKTEIQRIDEELKNPFLQNMGKLYTDERTKGYMNDPQFRTTLEYAMKDQKLLMQLMQTDPRFMDVFSVLSGLDLRKMQEEAQESKKREDEERAKKEKEEAERKKKEEAERKKKEEEDKYNNMSEEEKKDFDLHKQADEIKAQGNEMFKKKNFDEAIKLYEQAKTLYPKECAYYINLAKCYLEQKNFEKTLENCQYVIDNTFNFDRKAKAYGVMGYVYKYKEEYEKAMEYFEKSLLEKNDSTIKEEAKKLSKLMKDKEALAYINPEIAEQENSKANELYKAGKYPEALKVYNEAIRRNPKMTKYYTNRASCFIKLMEFASACKDCDKALELDSKCLNAYIRKANCHLFLKEYHKSLECVEKARAIPEFKDNKDLQMVYSKTMGAISSSSGADDEERVKHAYADPEIQALIKDPRIQQLFKDLKENPKVANEAIMKDEFIASAFKKLIASGIIKTG